jgi:ribosome maturation factor RimP
VPKTAPLFLFGQIRNAAGTGTGLTDIFDEKRYLRETGIETRIAALCAPVAASLGYRLVRVRLTGKGVKTLQIMAEDRSGQFAITDCEVLSRDLSAVLDVDDPIKDEYHLEVSSPGIDRPLVRRSDFERWAGHEAKIETHQPINGRRRYRGMLEGLNGDLVKIRLDGLPEETNPIFEIPLHELSDAKLILTDALLDMARQLQDELENDPLDDPDVDIIEDQPETPTPPTSHKLAGPGQ